MTEEHELRGDRPAVPNAAEAPESRRPRAGRWRTVCLCIAAFMMACTIAWRYAYGAAPPAVSPPAGDVMAGQAPFRFGIISDTRHNMAVVEEAMAGILRDNPALILHCGDIAQRYTPRQFDWVLHELGEMGLTVPFCPVPGNHDVDNSAPTVAERHRLYSRAFGPRRYWFSYANCLFVAYDDSSETCPADELAWLGRTLDLHRKDYTTCFVYMHVPPRDSRPEGRHALPPEDADALFNVLKDHRVSAVFAGHLHNYATYDMEGIPVYVTGGAGESRAPGEDHHYLVCDVADDGSFKVERHDIPPMTNDDYPEYALRVKYPLRFAAIASLVLLLAAVAPFGRRRQPPRL